MEEKQKHSAHSNEKPQSSSTMTLNEEQTQSEENDCAQAGSELEEPKERSESDKKVMEEFNAAPSTSTSSTISCEFGFSDPGTWPTT